VGLSGLINYRIDATRADQILQTIGGPDVYAQTVFIRPSNTALKEITPRYNSAEVIGKRDEIGQLTLANLQERMADFGIIVERVSVENVSLNQAFLDSVEQKQIAQQALERADFERQTAVKQAEGVRDARITVAEGEAQANDLINESLTPELLQWATIQKLAEDIKVMLLPSDQGLILDIGQVIAEEQ
jgi:regulator of protease activity HflC (stomatin/prohibitin superfamily)